MDQKNYLYFMKFFLIGLLASACAKPKSDDEVKATFNGYWMARHELEILNNAIEKNSCTLILEEKGLSLSAETINLNIMSIWPGGSIFALDTIIKKNAKQAQAHPDSVTAANIPGRFVDQGTLHIIEDSDPLKGALDPSEEDKFALAPFEADGLSNNTLFITLKEPDGLVFTMRAKRPADSNSDGYQSTYKKISLEEYRNMVDFSQACLDGALRF